MQQHSTATHGQQARFGRAQAPGRKHSGGSRSRACRMTVPAMHSRPSCTVLVAKRPPNAPPWHNKARTCQRVMSWRPPTTSAPSRAPKPPRRSQYLRLLEVGTGSSVLLLLSPPAAAAPPPQQALGGGMGGVTVAMLLLPMPMGRCLVDCPQPASTSASHSQARALYSADQCISTRRRMALRNCREGGLNGRMVGRRDTGGRQVLAGKQVAHRQFETEAGVELWSTVCGAAAQPATHMRGIARELGPG